MGNHSWHTWNESWENYTPKKRRMLWFNKKYFQVEKTSTAWGTPGHFTLPTQKHVEIETKTCTYRSPQILNLIRGNFNYIPILEIFKYET